VDDEDEGVIVVCEVPAARDWRRVLPREAMTRARVEVVVAAPRRWEPLTDAVGREPKGKLMPLLVPWRVDLVKR